MINDFLAGLVILAAFITGGEAPQPEPTLSAFGDPFLSIQLATDPDNGECLTTDGTDNIWSTCAAGSSSFSTTSANWWASLGLAFSTTSADYWETQQAARGGSGGSGNVATSTTESAGALAYWTSSGATPATLGNVATTTLTASSPLSLSNTVWKVGGSNSILTLDTSGTWTGNAGTASALAANGSNCTAGSYALGVDASGTSEGCTDATTEINSLISTHTGDAEAHQALVTLAGTPDYLTISGQQITRGTIDIGDDTNLTAGDGLTLTGDDVACDTASGSVFGCLSAANWTTFNSKLGSYDAWTHPQTNTSATTSGMIFTAASSTFTNGLSVLNGTTTNATSTSLSVSGQVDFDTLTSALILTGSTGILAEYAGASCTNQAVTALSALGATTCTTITSAYVDSSILTTSTAIDIDQVNGDTSDDDDLDVAAGGTGVSTLTGIVQGNGTSDFTAITNSSTAGQILRVTGASTYAWGALDLDDTDAFTGTLPASAIEDSFLLNNGDIGTGVFDFGGTTSFEITNGSNPTVDAIGEIALDTTSNYLLVATSTNASGSTVIPPFQTISFTYATTSWTGTTTLMLGSAFKAQEFKNAYCETTTGTVGVSLNDGTNRATYIPTASTTINLIQLGASNTFTAGESRRIDIGNPASSPVKVACTLMYVYTRD